VRYRSPAQAALLADSVSRRPVGTVSPVGIPYPIDVLFVSRQGERYTLWGLDLSADLALSGKLQAGASYSWVTYDSLSGAQPGTFIALNIPRNKGSLRMTYRDDPSGLTATAQVRAVSAFPLAPGTALVYGETTVQEYGVIDLQVDYAPERTLPNQTVSLSVQNVLNHAHSEFAGAPALGRLIYFRVRAAF
jgi:hypothetical protein